MDGVAEDVVAQERFERALVDDVSGNVEKTLDVQFEPGVLEETDGLGFVQFDQDVDVAGRTGLATRNRTEDSGVGDTHAAELRLVVTQDVEDGL